METQLEMLLSVKKKSVIVNTIYLSHGTCHMENFLLFRSWAMPD